MHATLVSPLVRTAKDRPNLTRCNGPSHATCISMPAPATCFPRVFYVRPAARWRLLVVEGWRDDGDVGRTRGAKESPRLIPMQGSAHGKRGALMSIPYMVIT